MFIWFLFEEMLKEQYHHILAQDFYKWRKCFLSLWNNNLKNALLNKVLKSSFLKEFRTATAFLQNVNNLQT